MTKCLLVLIVLAASSSAAAQTDPGDLVDLLKDAVVAPPVSEFQMRQYIVDGTAAPLDLPSSAQEWSSKAKRLRQHLLEEVAFHGWPQEWVNSPPKFEEVGVIETGGGYRIHKLRYEVVPSFESAALLYEPSHMSGKTPAILNLNGHVGPLGKTVEYKQKRCINYAKHGILALNLEWLSYGELDQKGNEHWFGAHLDLVGANELGIFFLEMRRG